MILGLFLLFGGCDRELKEHKGHPAVVKKLEMQNDPALQAKAVTGSVTLDPKIKAGIPEGAVLFIYARAQGVGSGPPVAVRKMTFFQLPQEFSISPADAVMTQEGFDGPLTLTARLDRDGNARAGAGDITGSLDVTTGQKGVTLVLSQVIEETGKKVTGTISIGPETQGATARQQNPVPVRPSPGRQARSAPGGETHLHHPTAALLHHRPG